MNDWETFNNQINKPVKSGKSTRAMKRLQVSVEFRSATVVKKLIVSLQGDFEGNYVAAPKRLGAERKAVTRTTGPHC